MQSFENQNIPFRKHTGKETTVHIVSETLINNGSFGKIFDTVVEVGGHKKRLIIKKYNDASEKYAKENAEHAFKNYSLAKEAGLKVFPTFRIGENGKSILMNTGFSNEQICIGVNNFKNVENLGRPFISEIINIDEFLLNLFTESQKATAKGLKLHSDVFFFIISRKEPAEMDFILGDLDNLNKINPEDYKERELIQHNMKCVETAFRYFLEKNVYRNEREKFLEKLTNYLNLFQPYEYEE